MPSNLLFFGDNLRILRDHVADESVDLVYLDPPFNSNRSYNIIFKEHDEHPSEAQIRAFEDTWHWDLAATAAYDELLHTAPEKVERVISALRSFIGENDAMAYLVMMTPRLLELHRVLKPTGSLYLHCDPTMSHYLKIVLDAIFGSRCFQNEIVWSYRRWPSPTNHFQRMHDTLLFYARTVEGPGTFNVDYEESSPSYRKRFKGKTQMLDPVTKTRKITLEEESVGLPRRDVWDISIIAGSSKERLGYPTQKPEALLERIIKASSNEGDVVLDPFCGCGTAIAAAEKLKRRWIGIDITHLAIALIRHRINAMFPGCQYEVIGEPEDLESARALAAEDRYQFQWWALSLVSAKPLGDTGSSKTVHGERSRTVKEGKKGSDRGVDGVIVFLDEAKRAPKRILISVKSGHVTPAMVRDLHGTVDREGAAMGVLITLEPPSKEMRTEAAAADLYDSKGFGKSYPKLQILTIEGLLNATERLQAPLGNVTFKQAPRSKREAGQRSIEEEM